MKAHLRRHAAIAVALIGAIAAAQPVSAQPASTEKLPAPVPIEQANYHWPVFKNDTVMVLRAFFPPGRGSNYHIHALDQFDVQIEAGANAGQEYGEPVRPARPGRKGAVGYQAYSKQPHVHLSTNTATTPFHNVVVALLKPAPAGNIVEARPAPYVEAFNNERARGWKIALEPGQTSPQITQKAPGIRIVIDGGEIAEVVTGKPDRGQWLRPGDFYWQDAGATRAIKNIGSTRIEIAEFEIK